jgi:hypothetical protein
MPGWRVHEFIDWVNFGRVYRKIHRKMDEPVWFLGRSHRVLFHDNAWAYLIAKEFYPGDTDAITSAQYHLYYDGLCSGDREYKKMLERFEILSRGRRRKDLARRRRAERALKKDPVLARFNEDMKKLAEAKKWMKYLMDR